MAKVHYCRCKINLSGQNYHTVVYNEHDPLTWPQVQVLMQLHGAENVMDVMPVKIGDVVPAREKERLIEIYGQRVVEAVFPGRQFSMGLMMTGDDQLPDIDAPPPQDIIDEAELQSTFSAPANFKPGRHAPQPRE